jgi:glycerate dehydrogenase
MIIKILDRAAIGNDTPLEEFKRFGEVIIYDKTPNDLLIERCSDADILIFNKIKLTKDVISAAKKLKLVCVFATGYDNIDIEAAHEKGIAVCNAPMYSTESVTLYTVATVLSLITKLKEYNDYVRCGAYSASGTPNLLEPVYHEIKGKKWGIIGCGNIGASVARIAVALGAEVLVNKRTPSEEFNTVDVDTLCKDCDIISVHCPLTPETRGLINKNRISKMKDGVVLVNEARGDVLCEKDVAEAVISGKISAFGCDVYSEEPFSESHPYYSIKDLNNVILTPHSAWASYEARCRCVNIIADNIESFLNGKTKNRVDLF